MNVTLLVHNQRGTGPFPKVMDLARGVAAAGASVSVVCTSPTRRLRLAVQTAGPVQVVEAPDLLWGRLRQGADLWNTLRRAAWLTGRPVDVVHAIDCRPAVILPALWAARRHRALLVLSWWDLFGRGGVALERSGRLYAGSAGRVEQFLEEHFRRYADAATVISDALRARLEALGFPSDRILLQRPGCDTEAFRPLPKPEARRQLGLPSDATILCYVGALARADVDLLLAALEGVQGSSAGPVLPLFVGTGGVDVARAQRLGARIVPRQPMPEVHRYICASDLCLLPLRETLANKARWPSKSGDYFTAGRPVVATRASDFGRLFPEHGLGFLAAEATPQGFAAAVIGALEARPTWETIGRSARRFAEQHLDVRVLGRELVAFYRQAQSNRGGARS